MYYTFSIIFIATEYIGLKFPKLTNSVAFYFMNIEDIKNFLENEPLIKQLNLSVPHINKVKSNKITLNNMKLKKCLLLNLSEIYYLLLNINNLNNLHIFCPICGKKNKFINKQIGYNKYCCKKCANSDINKINKMKSTCYNNIDENGDNIYQRGAKLGHQNRLKNIDENGLNGKQRAIIHQRETKFLNHGDPNYNNPHKANQTKQTNIDEEGLNSFERTVKKAKIKKLQIGDDGLNSYQRVSLKRKNDIDENGLNSYQRATKKGLETSQSIICENGLSVFKNGRLLAMKTNRKNHGGKHNWACDDPKLNGRATREREHGDPYYNNSEQAKQTRKNTIDENGLNINQQIALKNKLYFQKNYGVENNRQLHIKNVENINETFFRNNFIKDGIFLIKDCSEYFNTGTNWVNQKKLLFNIIEPNKQNQELEQFDVFNFIKAIYKGEILYNKRTIIPPQELDIYIPEKKLAIEFNGIYWHSVNNGTNKNYHQQKSKLCREKEIRLIHIYEDEWNDEHKREIIKDIIRHALNIPTYENKIYARKCIIKEIENKDYNDFCNKYHIQGTKGAQVKLGLFYNDKLVQIASFGKSRYDKQYEWEWIRGCPASNNNVIGGTSKLFKYFIKKYNPKSIVCYADFNKFDGRGYKECGFKFIKITAPDKFYYDTKNKIRLNRNPNKYKEYMNKVKSGEFFLLYGSGNIKFEWK